MFKYLLTIALLIVLFLLYKAFNVSTHAVFLQISTTLLGTLVAAWAGGLAAFRSEQKRKESEIKDLRITAANNAIFYINVIKYEVNRLNDNYLQPALERGDSNLSMSTPPKHFLKEISFDHSSIGFLLLANPDCCPQSVWGLNQLEDYYRTIVSLNALRTDAIEQLYEIDHGILQITFPGIHGVRQEFLRQRIGEYTTLFIHDVGACISLATEVEASLRQCLETLFPDQDFLTFNANRTSDSSSASERPQ